MVHKSKSAIAKSILYKIVIQFDNQRHRMYKTKSKKIALEVLIAELSTQ